MVATTNKGAPIMVSTGSEAVFIWTQEGRDGYGKAVGPIPVEAVVHGQEVVLPEVEDGPVAGTYKRVEPSVEVIITAQTDAGLPVFIHSDWAVYTKTWVHVPGGPIRNLGDAVEKVRKHLEQAADTAVAGGHMSVSPILTTSDGGNGLATRVDGRVVLIRPSGA